MAVGEAPSPARVGGDILSDDEEDVSHRPLCELYLGFCPSDEHITRFAQSLRCRLLAMGVSCTMPLGADVGSVAWRRELVRLLKRSSVYVPLVTAGWLASGEARLELYYALRRSIACAAPVVLPVLMPDAAAVGGPLVDRIRQQCFHCSWTPPTPLLTMLEEIRNFLVALRLPLQDCCPFAGRSFREVYQHQIKELGMKRPNSQVLRLLDGLDSADRLDLATDVSTTPPTAYLVGDQGLRPLLPVIRMKPDLRYLGLRGNGLTNNSMHGLVEALVVHPSVTAIDLGDNDITQLGAAELCYLLRRNQQITELKIDGTRILASEVWLRRVERQLEENRRSHFGQWVSVRCGQGFDEAAEVAWWEEAARAAQPLEQAEATEWDVALTRRVDPAGVELRVGVRRPGQGRPQPVMREAVPAGGELHRMVTDYLDTIDRRTVSIKKTTGATLKLVLEDVGGGVERIDRAVRELAGERAGGPAQGLSRSEVRILHEKAPGSRGRSFFVDCTVWTRDGARVGKELPQLFCENIQRFTGSLRNEVGQLIERLHDEELVLDEEREAWARLEEEEEVRMEQEEDRHLETIVDYWKASVPLFRQVLDGDTASGMAAMREVAASARRPELEARMQKCGSRLAEIERRYARDAAATPSFPPYWL